MTLVIDDPELDRLAQELADATGVSVAEAVRRALEAKHAECVKAEAKPKPKKKEINWAKIREIQDRVAALPILDYRPIDEMLYDEYGLPK